MIDSTALTPAVQLFGTQSQVVAQQATAVVCCDVTLSSMIDYKILIITCFVCYCAMLYYFKGYISALMKIFTKTNYLEKLMEEQGFLFAIFLRSLYVVGVMCWSIAIVKVVDMYAGVEIIEQLPSWGLFLVTIAVMIMCILVSLYRSLMLKTIANIGSVFAIAVPIERLSAINLGITTIITTPLILLIALSDNPIQNIGLYIVALAALCLLIFYLYKSYMLFVEQNVSIFYWFLYLCIVEIFPVSIFVLMVVKNTA